VHQLSSAVLSEINLPLAARSIFVTPHANDTVAGSRRAGAAMRWINQNWMVPREGETAWDVAIDVAVALFGAAVATEFIRLIF
jgi:hypothetical protein